MNCSLPLSFSNDLMEYYKNKYMYNNHNFIKIKIKPKCILTLFAQIPLHSFFGSTDLFQDLVDEFPKAVRHDKGEILCYQQPYILHRIVNKYNIAEV